MLILGLLDLEMDNDCLGVRCCSRGKDTGQPGNSLIKSVVAAVVCTEVDCFLPDADTGLGKEVNS